MEDYTGVSNAYQRLRSVQFRSGSVGTGIQMNTMMMIIFSDFEFHPVEIKKVPLAFDATLSTIMTRDVT